MGLLDPLFNAVAKLVNFTDEVFESITNPDVEGEQASQALGGAVEDLQPADELAAVLIDAIEEGILDDLQDAGIVVAEGDAGFVGGRGGSGIEGTSLGGADAEAIADQTEGAAAAALLGTAVAGTSLELGTLGQLEGQNDFLIQALAGLGVDDVTGLELEARAQEGILPALERQANRDHRAKEADLADHAELGLRSKSVGGTNDDEGNQVPVSDLGWVDSEDLGWLKGLEKYGVRPQDREKLEFVSLASADPEQLFEELPQAGLVPTPEAVDAVNDLSGFPEVLKEEYRRMQQQTPERADLWEQTTRTEALVAELDKRVRKGELTPQQAVDRLPEIADPAVPALRARFEGLADLPPDSPTATDFEDSFSRGLSGVDTFEDRLARFDLDPETYSDVIDAKILAELDGDLRTAAGLGLISEGEFSDLAGRVGLDDETVQALLSGEDLDDIAERRLAGQQSAPERSVRTLVGIGPNRGSALQAAGIETVADLAQADPQTVADAAQVSPETAEGFVSQARQRTN